MHNIYMNDMRVVMRVIMQSMKGVSVAKTLEYAMSSCFFLFSGKGLAKVCVDVTYGKNII